MATQNKTYNKIISEVAEELGLSPTVVDKTYRAFWLFVRTSISELPLSQDLTEAEFNQLHTSINIPSLGKFVCTYDRYMRMKQRFKYIKYLQENAECKEN